MKSRTEGIKTNTVKTKKIKEINIMKVKVFICTLAFLHIKEEILMKRKNYKVKVKLIFETTMDHSQTSMQKAQEDVNRVLQII